MIIVFFWSQAKIWFQQSTQTCSCWLLPRFIELRARLSSRSFPLIITKKKKHNPNFLILHWQSNKTASGAPSDNMLNTCFHPVGEETETRSVSHTSTHIPATDWNKKCCTTFLCHFEPLEFSQGSLGVPGPHVWRPAAGPDQLTDPDDTM